MKLVPCEKVIYCEEHRVGHLINSQVTTRERRQLMKFMQFYLWLRTVCSDMNGISILVAVKFTLDVNV